MLKLERYPPQKTQSSHLKKVHLAISMEPRGPRACSLLPRLCNGHGWFRCSVYTRAWSRLVYSGDTQEKLPDPFRRKYMKEAVRASTIHVSFPNYSIVLNLLVPRAKTSTVTPFFYCSFRRCLHDTGATFAPERVHSDSLSGLYSCLHDTTTKCHAGASHPSVSSPWLLDRSEKVTPVRNLSTV